MLVGVDGSKGSFTACRVAANLASKVAADVRILCVMPGTSIYTAPLVGEMNEQLNLVGTGYLKKAASIAESENVTNVTTKAVRARDSIVRAITDDARDSRCDLIVLGRRGLGGFKTLALGSVSSGVAAHARCSVLVVRDCPSDEERTQIKRLLLAVDGSQKVAEATNVAAGLAKALGGDLTVLHVIHIPSYVYGDSPDGAIDRYLADARAEGEKYLSDAASSVKSLGVNQAKKAMMECLSSPSKGIIEYADKNRIDLIVVGTRGLGGFKRLLLGSVASGVLGYANCSVIIVR